MLLEMKSISKSYGTVVANDDVSFNLKKGEVHALIGENGAGKTTLMRILYGMESPTSGEIFINGKQVVFQDPNDAIANKIGMVHQHFMLFSSFSIAENIVIGKEPKKGLTFNRKEAIEATKALSEKYSMPVDPTKKVSECSLGVQQRIEILKVLFQGAEVIILDEPTGVLTPLEVKELLTAIKSLTAQGMSFIIISHKLSEIMEISDRITVLRDGKVTGTVVANETSEEELSKMMVGRELIKLERPAIEPGHNIVELKNINLKGNKTKPLLNNINLQVRAGEIVGIAGISGNGQSELLQVISGLTKPDSGELRLYDKNLTGASVKEIRANGLAHIPEDRYLWGVSKDATVSDNGIMCHLDKVTKKGIIQHSKVNKLVSSWVKHFQIKTGSLYTKAQFLSGGNLQKLIVARELAQNTSFVIAAEPTRGVDVGAMEIIHTELLNRRAENGAILLVSSELTEVMKLSDRILVMYEGEIVGQLDASQATEEQISLLMAGGKADASR